MTVLGGLLALKTTLRSLTKGRDLGSREEEDDPCAIVDRLERRKEGVAPTARSWTVRPKAADRLRHHRGHCQVAR
jgi:hypothetical protein